MNDGEITRWIRWLRCKVILSIVAEYLSIILLPISIVIWIAIRYAHLCKPLSILLGKSGASVRIHGGGLAGASLFFY